ncbi:hypothetical protein [Cognatiyoonia sp. IB215182]|uniref:hypothetical protein n=1 Tax=Cognatiyoonia sp. IB215182 TaxID=3097353 RepID=UPI002A15010F|nr:hypothetical protein [Cognatiyoonia sp. IB215182]MDX8355121.1 hypothetical protein [Cognatiyoonia sp. IB215182]
MFHKVEDIKAMLSPLDLSSVRPVDETGHMITFSKSDLCESFKAIAHIEADEQGLVSVFAEKNGVGAAIHTGLQGLEEKLPEAFGEAGIDPWIIYDFGVRSFGNGQIADAAYAFTILSSNPELRSVSLLGLAACACHQEEYETALVFAKESITCHDAHPRTYLIAGYSALRSGDKKMAKRQLALAARLARGDARLRGEQRCAQRELLLMQLAS